MKCHLTIHLNEEQFNNFRMISAISGLSGLVTYKYYSFIFWQKIDPLEILE